MNHSPSVRWISHDFRTILHTEYSKQHLLYAVISLTANIFRTKHDTDNQKKVLKTTKSLTHSLKISQTLSTNGYKQDLCFYPTYVNSVFCLFTSAKWDANNGYKQPRQKQIITKSKVSNHTCGLIVNCPIFQSKSKAELLNVCHYKWTESSRISNVTSPGQTHQRTCRRMPYSGQREWGRYESWAHGRQAL